MDSKLWLYVKERDINLFFRHRTCIGLVCSSNVISILFNLNNAQRKREPKGKLDGVFFLFWKLAACYIFAASCSCYSLKQFATIAFDTGANLLLKSLS